MVTIEHARQEALTLLNARRPGATICPSEVARRAAANAAGGQGADWREAMPAVHAAVDGLVEEGIVSLSWKGALLERRAGPYRITRLPKP